MNEVKASQSTLRAPGCYRQGLWIPRDSQQGKFRGVSWMRQDRPTSPSFPLCSLPREGGRRRAHSLWLRLHCALAAAWASLPAFLRSRAAGSLCHGGARRFPLIVPNVRGGDRGHGWPESLRHRRAWGAHRRQRDLARERGEDEKGTWRVGRAFWPVQEAYTDISNSRVCIFSQENLILKELFFWILKNCL